MTKCGDVTHLGGAEDGGADRGEHDSGGVGEKGVYGFMKVCREGEGEVKKEGTSAF